MTQPLTGREQALYETMLLLLGSARFTVPEQVRALSAAQYRLAVLLAQQGYSPDRTHGLYYVDHIARKTREMLERTYGAAEAGNAARAEELAQSLVDKTLALSRLK